MDDQFDVSRANGALELAEAIARNPSAMRAMELVEQD